MWLQSYVFLQPYVYADHAQYTIKTYAKMALFPLILTSPLSIDLLHM